MAQQLSSTAERVAETFEDVAHRKDVQADAADSQDASGHRGDARRAREFADKERTESRRLREQWDLPS
ncbi:hypothetical protein [Actinomycetospora succinea]|uniref:hypothetical protein n=1 Tax=Actinomycetospora succinea TaxID=663603 RepID=UPI0010616735|nr:hypothetical protein [Actinomycetospora succinea]